jgi:hypothetical protein
MMGRRGKGEKGQIGAIHTTLYYTLSACRAAPA